jgi:hypothetical protein
MTNTADDNAATWRDPADPPRRGNPAYSPSLSSQP